jgi:iron complex outermembrane receptor protein
VSRALETPSSTDTAENLTVGGFLPPLGPPVVVSIVGNPAFENEVHVVYELGYRVQPSKRLSLDLAAYYDSEHQLPTTQPEAAFLVSDPAPLHLVMPLLDENAMYGASHGIEVFANWKVTDRWTLTPGYTYEGIHLHVTAGSLDTQSAPTAEGSSPRQWARVDSHLAMTRNLTWDASANFVGRLSSPAVPSYTRVDTQLTWRPGEHISLSIVGQNLVEDRHLEFSSSSDAGPSNFITRSAYGKLTWSF